VYQKSTLGFLTKCLEVPNFRVDNTLKLNKIQPSLLFLVIYIFQILFLKCSFSIKNPILKMIDYEFSIQGFVQGYPLQS